MKHFEGTIHQAQTLKLGEVLKYTLLINSIHSYREMHCLLLHTLMLLKNDICTHSHLLLKQHIVIVHIHKFCLKLQHTFLPPETAVLVAKQI